MEHASPLLLLKCSTCRRVKRWRWSMPSSVIGAPSSKRRGERRCVRSFAP
jgi:hypothetical protein